VAERVNVIPPVRCSARSKRTKRQCGNWATPGLPVCRFHGAGAHHDVAVQRRTLATLLASDPRPVWTVLLDAVHTADALARDARLQVVADDEPTARQVESVVDSAKLAAHFSKIALDTGAATKIAEAIQRNVDGNGRLVAEVLGRVLDALLDGLALPSDRAHELRTWAFTTTRDLLSTLDPEAGADVEVPPPPLAGLAVVPTDRPQLEPAVVAASSSAVDDRRAAGQRRPTAVDTAAARPAPAGGTSTPAADQLDDDRTSDEARDAGPVDEPDPDLAPNPDEGDDLSSDRLPFRLLTVGRTRAQLAALAGLTLSAVWRAQHGRVHDDELPAWRRALAQLDGATNTTQPSAPDAPPARGDR
jgi:hypothetical protein